MRLRRILAAGVLACAVAALAACGDDGDGGPRTGEQVYRQSCASCHGLDGGGGMGPSLTDVADRLEPEEHERIVREGKGQMPGFDGRLSDEEIELVVDYERTFG